MPSQGGSSFRKKRRGAFAEYFNLGLDIAGGGRKPRSKAKSYTSPKKTKRKKK
jgi:hypothetical protein